MAGYFKVPIGVVRELLDLYEGPELLGGYMVLAEGAYGNGRQVTDCGAQSIQRYTGCTNYRAKRIFNDLRSLRFGEKGELGMVTPANRTHRNADVHLLDAWEGPHAYMPSLFVKSSNVAVAPLRRLCETEEEPEVKRDALALLAHLYASTEYAEWMGARPERFLYQEWEFAGGRSAGNTDYELGHIASVSGHQIWAGSPNNSETWRMSKALQTAFFGDDGEHDIDRVWRALWLLLNDGLVCKVAIVAHQGSSYPLWVFNPAYRSSLAEQFGIHTGLADDMYRLAADADADPDNGLIIAATEEGRSEHGTGVYFCIAGSRPSVFTVLCPRIHAPTPVNMDQLAEVALITRDWARRIRRLRSTAKAA